MKNRLIILLVLVGIFTSIFYSNTSYAQFSGEKNSNEEVEQEKHASQTFTNRNENHQESEKNISFEHKNKQSKKANRKAVNSKNEADEVSSNNSSSLISVFYVIVSHLLSVPDHSSYNLF